MPDRVTPFNAVHSPRIAAPPELVAKYRKKNGVKSAHSAANLEIMDVAVGQILKAIDDKGIRDNTLVIFFNGNRCEFVSRLPAGGWTTFAHEAIFVGRVGVFQRLHEARPLAAVGRCTRCEFGMTDPSAIRDHSTRSGTNRAKHPPGHLAIGT